MEGARSGRTLSASHSASRSRLGDSPKGSAATHLCQLQTLSHQFSRWEGESEGARAGSNLCCPVLLSKPRRTNSFRGGARKPGEHCFPPPLEAEL